jgi:3-methyladenine DNA glycosylase AlkD
MDDRASFVQQALAVAANPDKAAGMARYLKTTDPFYGVQKAGRTKVFREMERRFPIETASEYEAAIHDLWALPHREEKYLAISIATRHTEFITVDRLPLYRRLITEGAWWDFVDDVAARAVGIAWQREREAATAVMRKWVDDADMWLRRTAIIGQLKHKGQTDEPTLFGFCERRAHETEFFIRKAIGWALREYAKTAPDAVRSFAASHRDMLSGLSYREATKHL